MTPSVLTSDQRELFESRLAAGPNYPDQNRPTIVLAVVAWITTILRHLLAFVSHWLGVIHDDLAAVVERIDELEANQPRQVAPVSTTLPAAALASATTSNDHSSLRCRRCRASGHDTTQCRTKNPDLVKKRVDNNKKAKKEIERQRANPLPHNRLPPYNPYLFNLQDYFYERPPPPPPCRPGMTTRSMTALAVDAQEFRRRQSQSARDKRRKGATSTTTS
jgi:hypothetical protein